MNTCQFCAEEVHPTAMFCPHCGKNPRGPMVSERVDVDMTFAWLLAFAPLILVLLDAATAQEFPNWTAGYGSVLVALALNAALALLDQQRLSRAGVEISPALALLLVPVYLIVRTVRTKSTAAIPAIWCIALLASFVGYNYVVGVPMDTSLVEQGISSDLNDQLGTEVDVQCPESAFPHVGGSFTCTVRSGQDQADVIVTVQDTDGTYAWQVH